MEFPNHKKNVNILQNQIQKKVVFSLSYFQIMKSTFRSISQQITQAQNLIGSVISLFTGIIMMCFMRKNRNSFIFGCNRLHIWNSSHYFVGHSKNSSINVSGNIKALHGLINEHSVNSVDSSGTSLLQWAVKKSKPESSKF